MGIQGEDDDFPVPADEDARLRALLDLGILDTADEERFDRITRTAARVFDVPIALVSLVDAHRQWTKSCIGLDDREIPRGHSICSRALLGERQLVVEDLTRDPLFAANPLVSEPGGLRFYAGHVLRAPDGHRVGTLCVAAREPRAFCEQDRRTLADLGAMAEQELSSTDLVEALRERSHSEQRLRAVMDGVADGVVVYGPDGLIDSVNPAAEELFGRSQGKLVGTVVSDLLHDVSWPLLAALLQGAGGQSTIVGRRMEATAKRADGTRFPLEIATGRAEAGGHVLYVAVGRDVTARREADRQLSRARRRNQLLLESANEAIIGLDEQGTILFVNPSCSAMVGKPAEELVGKRIDHAIQRAGQFPPIEESPLLQTMRDGRSRRFERQVVRADGTAFPAEVVVAATPRDEDDGDLAAGVMVMRDITQRYEVDRMKHEFVSVVGHELRTPLTSIRGSLGLLAGGVMGQMEPDAQRMLDIAVANTDRLVRLINDILDLERIESGRVELELEPQSARGLLQSTAQVVAANADAAGVALRIEAGEELVLGDRDRLVQALTNLVGNAIKFSPRGEEVLLSTAVVDDEVRFLVRDRGRGIPPDRLERVFERFEQVDASDARDKGGTGLGLAIARSIADQHSGRLWAQETPGGGATFVMALQRLRAPIDDRRAVLLTGDDRARHRVSPVLARAGYTVVDLAEGGPYAAVVVAGDPSDATDDLTELARDPLTAEVPIVFVGRQDDDELLSALECAVPAFAPARVLVVEDDADLGRVLVSMIERHGARVALVRTGQQAIEELDAAPPDLLVLDLVLPQGDGFAVVDHLRSRGEQHARMPLVVYTAMELGSRERERLQTGRTRIMTKGFASPADVEQHVLRLLEALP